jgi:hypothetical protein
MSTAVATAPAMTDTAAPSFTLTRRGEEFTFSTLHNIDTAADALAGSRSQFALDLLAAKACGRLTRNQAQWLLFLAEEAKPTINTPSARPGSFHPLLDAMTRMQEEAQLVAGAKGRNAGKVTLRFVGATASTVIQGPNVGCLYVKADGVYMGKITLTGEFRPAYGIDPSAVIEALTAAQKDPTAAAIAYGRETGNCSCCGRELTNAESIALGIGPICLDRLGGAWG